MLFFSGSKSNCLSGLSEIRDFADPPYAWAIQNPLIYIYPKRSWCSCYVAEAKDAGVLLARSPGIREVLASYSQETILLVEMQEAKIPPMPTCYLI